MAAMRSEEDSGTIPTPIDRLFREVALEGGIDPSIVQQYLDHNDLCNETVGASYESLDTDDDGDSSDVSDGGNSASGGGGELPPRAAFLQPFIRYEDFRDWSPEERRRQNINLAREQGHAERATQEEVDLEVK